MQIKLYQTNSAHNAATSHAPIVDCREALLNRAAALCRNEPTRHEGIRAGSAFPIRKFGTLEREVVGICAKKQC